MRRLPPAVLLLFITAACGDDDAPPPADGGPDAGADAGARDAGSDAGPTPPPLCAICRRDSDCAEGALCLVLADGERGCGVPCAGDADCAGLGDDALCEEEVPGLPLQCRPTAGSCVTVAAGTSCEVDADCGGRYDVCVDADGLGGRCTSACEVDADCPVGMRRCREARCIPDDRPAAERCASIVDAGGATTCTSDADCGGGRCAMVAGARVCSAPVDGPISALSADCLCHAVAVSGSLFDEALESIGRTRCDLRWDSELFDLIDPSISHDPYRLSATERVFGDWNVAVPFASRVAADLDQGESSAAAALARAAAWADADPGAPAPAEPAPLVDALVGLIETTGDVADRAALETAAAALSPEVSTALGRLVVALEAAHLDREIALARLGDDRDTFFFGASGLLLGDLRAIELRRDDQEGALRGDVDVARLATAATRLAATIEAADFAALAGRTGDLTVETPIGRIAVRGGTAGSTYADAEWHRTLLLVDLGGDDTYRFPAGATTGADHGLAIVIDAGGNDTYGYDEVADPGDTGPAGHHRVPSDADGRGRSGPAVSLSRTPRQGAGLLGVGMLVDLGAGTDRYSSHRMSQGYGALGVGLLVDGGGDDLYEGEALVQGAAAFGVGLLFDRGGSDDYFAYHEAQGFAYARAFGALWDGGGDDDYVMVPDDPLYPSAQDAGTNASLGQGAGFGRRADFTPDLTFMSGGIGILRDVAGTDTYRAGIFAQASGYWFGTGLLVDSLGNDRYDGQWYVQSGSAHFAISVLLEEAGDDVYNETARRQNVALGGGHDFSIAYFVDRSGADEYHAPGLSLGAGNAAGTGVFADAAGVDSYDTYSDFSFGNASIDDVSDVHRREMRTVGIFLDAEGADTHMRPTVAPVVNDGLWRQTIHAGDTSEEGVGVNRATSALGL